MTLSDEALFDFDKSQLASWDEARAAEALDRVPDLYRNHLVLARWLERWADVLATGSSAERDWQRGYAHGLREVAAHLRQADLIPGGVLYEEQTS